MGERITPTKFERRQYFAVANFAANIILADTAATKRREETPLPRWQDQMTKELEKIHRALPFVANMLILPDIRESITEPKSDIRLRIGQERFTPEMIGIGGLILATGLERTVSYNTLSDETVFIHPDDDPEKVRFEAVRKLNRPT